MVTVSVLICTHRRPDRLAHLLDDLTRQSRLPDEIVIVENDLIPTTEDAVTAFASRVAFPVRYAVEPRKNISLTRNHTVRLASGDWLAFVDDDERVPTHWLEKMLDTAILFDAEGVLGPVVCVPPPDAPPWIRRGNLYAEHHAITGAPVRRERMWVGNALLRGDLVRAEPGPFDEKMGLTGGEDSDMLARLTQRGMKIVWCEEAAVMEPVEPARLKPRWILLRAMRGGQTYARLWRLGRYGDVGALALAVFMLRAVVQALIALALALLLLPAGRHRSMYWLAKAAANTGKLTTLTGWRYEEYAGSDDDDDEPVAVTPGDR
ncbi:MAG: glycosyltransferase family 2 protein [Panacagrimonas sp.]